MNKETEEWVSTIEAAKTLGVSITTIQRRARNGQIPSMKIGPNTSARIFKRSDIAAQPIQTPRLDPAARRKQVRQLRDEGHTMEAIATFLGISHPTVSRDLAYLSQMEKTDAPSTITSAGTDPETGPPARVELATYSLKGKGLPSPSTLAPQTCKNEVGEDAS